MRFCGRYLIQTRIENDAAQFVFLNGDVHSSVSPHRTWKLVLPISTWIYSSSVIIQYTHQFAPNCCLWICGLSLVVLCLQVSWITNIFLNLHHLQVSLPELEVLFSQAYF